MSKHKDTPEQAAKRADAEVSEIEREGVLGALRIQREASGRASAARTKAERDRWAMRSSRAAAAVQRLQKKASN